MESGNLEPRTLTEAASPVFVFLTAFRRNAETMSLSADELRAELQRQLEEVRSTCDANPHLRKMIDRSWYALVAACDQIVLTSTWSQRLAWSTGSMEMALFGSAEGGKRFFLVCEETLTDGAPEAAEMAEFLHMCLALGVQGEYARDRAELERIKKRLADKAGLHQRVGAELTPEAYGRNETRSLRMLPTVGILRLLTVALAAMVFAWVWGTFVTKFMNAEIAGKAQRATEMFERVEEPE